LKYKNLNLKIQIKNHVNFDTENKPKKNIRDNTILINNEAPAHTNRFAFRR